MPIPPRPVPAHTHSRHRRPGTAIPRKSLYTTSRASTTASLVNDADYRADIPYLPPFAFSSSAPNTLSGIRLIARTPTPDTSRSIGSSSSLSRSPTPTAPPANEVPLDALLSDGRGRPKRTGAAAALGFDFVARPHVLALDADQATEPAAPAAPAPGVPRPSLWQWRTPETAPSTVASERVEGAGAGALSAPPTPALEPVQPLSDDEEDDWEHVDHEDDAAVMVGELELEDATTTTSSDADGDRDKTVGHESYADAVRA
ncbi:hypothetical protein Q8F55_003950 [Vanrija albida]|uniref:Uncharacterized protein n=1 Tax=Vanrija albida TaxID=181172 RepID=A0ABR3Q670_9TREE